jgi:hypothetical protein
MGKLLLKYLDTKIPNFLSSKRHKIGTLWQLYFARRKLAEKLGPDGIQYMYLTVFLFFHTASWILISERDCLFVFSQCFMGLNGRARKE